MENALLHSIITGNCKASKTHSIFARKINRCLRIHPEDGNERQHTVCGFQVEGGRPRIQFPFAGIIDRAARDHIYDFERGVAIPSERWVLSLVSDAALPIGSNGLEKSLQTAENESWADCRLIGHWDLGRFDLSGFRVWT